MDGYFTKKIGNNRGAPRVWLEGLQTSRAGFTPGARYDVEVQGQTVVLSLNPDGSRVVSSKMVGERANPIIDLNSRELLAAFDGMASIRVAVKDGEIYLVPLASELKKQERFKRLREKLERGEPLAAGSLAHGGGILTHAVHTGLRNAGIETELKFANEIRSELLDHAAIHNDAWNENTMPIAAPVQEFAFDERGLAQLPKIEILEMGLPCSGHSVAGLAKRGHGIPEAHPEVGHLVVSALIIINKTNPACILFENVPGYESSASAAILRNQLRDLGYHTEERMLSGKEWGAIENRDRWCMVAVTEGIDFKFDQLMPPKFKPRQLGDILEPIAPDDPIWSPMEGLKAKQERDIAEGKGFRMQVYNEGAESIGTIGKGYTRNRSTEPKIVHKDNPDLLRLLTPNEHAAAKQIPPRLVAGLPKTTANEVLGQSIIYEPFQDTSHHMGNAINRFVGRAEVSLLHRDLIPDLPTARTLDEELAEIAAEVVATFKRADTMQGRYSGSIVAMKGDFIIQDVGRNEGVLHSRAAFDKAPKLGQEISVQYREGKASFQVREKQQMSLTL
jgi:DNA (cytosine-5)-methyltransferase 1